MTCRFLTTRSGLPEEGLVGWSSSRTSEVCPRQNWGRSAELAEGVTRHLAMQLIFGLSEQEDNCAIRFFVIIYLELYSYYTHQHGGREAKYHFHHGVSTNLQP